MRIVGQTIILRSSEEWYWLEEGGEKPNTLRLMDEDEFRRAMIRKPKFISIELAGDPSVNFIRTISGIHLLDTLLGKLLVMVCWKEEE